MSVFTLNAQSWIVENLYGVSDPEQAFNLVAEANGNVTHIGYTYSQGNPLTFPNVQIVHCDPLGNALWEMVYNVQVATPNSANIPTTEMSITQAANGDYLWTTGVHASGGAEVDIIICRINAAGNIVWTTTIGVGNGAIDYGTSIIEDPATGEIYITGYSNEAPTAGSGDVIVAKLSGTGTSIWQNKYGGSNGDRGRCIRKLSGGDFVIAGESRSFSGSWDGLQFTVDATGAIGWDRRYGAPTGEHEGFQSIMEHGNGKLYACGARIQGGNYDVYVVESDPAFNGQATSSAYYNRVTGGEEFGWHITRAANGTDMVVVGQVPGIIGGNYDGFRMEISTSLLATAYRLYGTPSDDLLRCIEYTPGNSLTGPTEPGYFMLGYTDVQGTDDMYLLRTNLVGKTGCDEIESISETYVTGNGNITLALNSYSAPVNYQLDELGVGSYLPWCPGQYVTLFQPKTGVEMPRNVALTSALEVSPQPLNIGAQLTVNFTLDSAAELEVALFDMRGRQVYTVPFTGVAGANTLRFTPSGLSSGNYVLQLKGLAKTASINLILME